MGVVGAWRLRGAAAVNDWNCIRDFYKARQAKIHATPKNRWALDPYAWESAGISMTPIERALWHDIRCESVVVYPQYPVGRFFVDFANPVAKVAIECDGAAYHRDKAKDDARDAELRRMGWFVHRISGRDCKTVFDEATGERSQAQLFLDFITATHGISCLQECDDDDEFSGMVMPASHFIKLIDWATY